VKSGYEKPKGDEEVKEGLLGRKSEGKIRAKEGEEMRYPGA
jgi:hypothetical protein